MPASKHRLGLTVEQLINKLQEVKDKTVPVVYHGFGAGNDADVTSVKDVKECQTKGALGCYSFEEMTVVWIG